ncbi:hypothetical protein HDU76_005828 [Blyttiomyces sp. JEL0837]|nr:hypothetical protein HDU76_005828 [Blyttiomyces sp. JEL0837]
MSQTSSRLLITIIITIISTFPSTTSAATCYSHFTKDTYPSCQLLAPNYALHWSVSSDGSTITMAIDADVPVTSGSWIGIGLSDMGGMRGGDEWVLLQRSNGSYYVQDSHTSDYGTPTADSSQDVTLIQPPTAGASYTTFVISRSLDTCDDNDIPIKIGKLHNLIWAYGTANNQAISQHASNARGDSKAILYPDPKAPAIPADPSDLKPFEIRMPNITIPSNTTSYLCTHFEMPSDARYQVYYTKQTRQYDAGTLLIGQVTINIPGDSPSYTVLNPNICPSSCTSKFPGNLTIISSGVHMHLLGYNQTVRQIRGGTELPTLVSRRYYDFNYQGQVGMGGTIVPGDTLLTTCAYIPTEGIRTNVTKYGESSSLPDIDLCLNVDAVNMAICTTTATLKTANLSSNGGVSGFANKTQADMLAVFQKLMAMGAIVPASLPAYTPYSPTCIPSVSKAGTSTQPGKSDARLTYSVSLIPVLFVVAVFAVLIV